MEINKLMNRCDARGRKGNFSFVYLIAYGIRRRRCDRGCRAYNLIPFPLFVFTSLQGRTVNKRLHRHRRTISVIGTESPVRVVCASKTGQPSI